MRPPRSATQANPAERWDRWRSKALRSAPNVPASSAVTRGQSVSASGRTVIAGEDCVAGTGSAAVRRQRVIGQPSTKPMRR